MRDPNAPEPDTAGNRRGQAALVAATLAAAVIGAGVFRALHLPLATILGSLCGAALVANGIGAMSGGRALRRGGQLFVGASVGAVLSPDILGVLLDLLPLMVATAVGANLLGVALAFPLSRISRLDRLTAVLCSLPAGMAEMATLAQELKADEQAVALVHTLRVVMVLSLLPIWLGPVAGVGQAPQPLSGMADLREILPLVAVAWLIAAAATRLRIVNAWIIAPMLLSVGVVAAGHTLPPVPPLFLLAAQIAIGTSLGLRFNIDQIRRLPRIALGGFLCGLTLIGASFALLAPAVKNLAGFDQLSAVLAVAPGGLGEMIASAGTLGLLAAAVAGFQLARTILTNLVAPPVIRWVVGRGFLVP